jgi:hypothetical protein
VEDPVASGKPTKAAVERAKRGAIQTGEGVTLVLPHLGIFPEADLATELAQLLSDATFIGAGLFRVRHFTLTASTCRFSSCIASAAEGWRKRYPD